MKHTVLSLVVLVAQGVAPARGEERPAPRLEDFVERYCVECHSGEGEASGGVALDALDTGRPANAPQVWERVVRKLRHRQMPPAEMPRPSEAQYEAVLAELEGALDRAAAGDPRPGRTDTFRRLTRIEYRNAVRDLLGVEIDAAELLPKDEASHGFDNITVGALSPTLLERYMAAAKQISRLALGRPGGGPQVQTFTVPPDRTQEDHIAGLPLGTRGGTVARHVFPRDGEYEIRLQLTRDRNEEVEGLSEPHQIDVLLDGQLLQRLTVAPPPAGSDHDGVDQHLMVRTAVAAGPHRVAAAFVPKTGALIESERQPYLARFNRDRHPRSQPALHAVSITGPYASTGPGQTPSRERIFTRYPEDASEEDACAREIISRLVRRAYRRPVGEQDLAAPLRFYAEAKAEEGFEAGMEMALRAILISPRFLFRIERDPPGVAPGAAYRLPQIELASRLSFFLWSSIPDEPLLAAAERGALGEPEEFERQVRRMLEDRRASALVENFAAQWLYLRNLEGIRPDPRRFPDFDDNLRQALRRETELFVESVLREQRSVLDLLGADYTYLNERLAKHYGIPHVYGSRFRRVPLDGASHRGGLLRQGSILTVTSYANRTSPVVRGTWVLANILGTPPDPPPPDVPQLEERSAAAQPRSVRQRVAAHRANPACAQCHDLIDPVGFALENYDAIGRWRTREAGRVIDASGELPDGSRFCGAAELQETLRRRPEWFVTTVVEKLMTYALGRGLEATDAPAVRRVVREAEPGGYRFSDLILGVARSTPFQMRRAQ